MKLANAMEKIKERSQSDKIDLMMGIFKTCVFIVIFSHCTACIWWGLGDRAVDQQTVTWVSDSTYGRPPASLDTASLGLRYVTSVHWSISQLTGGMDEFLPGNFLERIYAVVIYFCAFMAATMIVSSLTSNLTQLHIIRSGHSQKVATLKKYLKQNSISGGLALRIQRSALHALSGDLTPEAVELLTVVSNPLRVELDYELYADVFRTHPMFNDIGSEAPQALRRVCHFGCSMLLLDATDVAFSEGEAGTAMYFIVKGELDYVGEQVGPGSWAAEAGLWTTWVHRGTLLSIGDVKIVTLQVQTFQDIVSRFTFSDFDTKKYGQQFVAFLNKDKDATDLSKMA